MMRKQRNDKSWLKEEERKKEKVDVKMKMRKKEEECGKGGR